MSAAVVELLEKIYTSIHNDNEGIDELIVELKGVLKSSAQKEVVVEPARLVQNNRQGRKMMQSYFKKRGVTIKFAKGEEA